MIHEIVQGHIERERERSTWNERHEGKLAVSEIGHCPRKAMLRLHGMEETDPHDAYVQRLMWSGKLAEMKLERALRAAYQDNLKTQVHVENAVFMGTVDFITPEAIVEHKETAGTNFKYKRLPYEFHLYQVLAYQHLYGNKWLDAILFYQNRADWAEFRVWEILGADNLTQAIGYEGQINGNPMSGSVDTTLAAEMSKLALWYNKDKVAPRYETPFEKQFACTRMYKTVAYPGCTYFSYCWPEHKGADRLTIPKEKRR